MKPYKEFFTEVRLEAVRTALCSRISERSFRNNVEVDAYIERITNDMIIRLERQTYGSGIAQYDETITVPATWWDHFKDHMLKKNYWWMRWLKQASRPNYTSHRFTAEGRLMFPDIPAEFREQHRTFVVYDHSIRPLLAHEE